MPPFLPGDRRVPRSRNSGQRTLDAPKVQSKAERAKKIAVDDRDYEDVDSQADTEFTFSHIPNHTHHDPDKRDMSRGAGDTPLRGSRTESVHQQRESDDLADRFDASMHFPQGPFAPVYEHCLVLRRHGASVKFGSSTSRGSNVRSPTCRPPMTTTDHFHPDVYNPTTREIQLLDQALAFVLSSGGEVEFHPLIREQPSPYSKCDACSEAFMSPRDREDHCTPIRNVCQPCQKSFTCRTFHEQHMKQTHKLHHGGRYEPFDDRTDGKWRGTSYGDIRV
ncbi:uncharacterized protein Z518_06963 [Rhinocladiella mackenziei CBS 650.93]|uniref:C2H2-type domain-containing protein n=1 Tax=Rhinocladiella mackenziei CBS 650.93 TaxID=1442369 RepID=A0A0D2IJI3_9EURO|nr:uncharacterized protein Z518_06963 [Rhinocladiella mackenziei CBS 650.93]KIX03411.1 hypothetical protein Z518_06963 [Rhinocladiella mackenziei CBS 650.93]